MAEAPRICFVVNEYPVHGKVGGFGVLTRDLAKGLKNRGWDVCVLVPRHPKIAENMKEDETIIEGVKVFTIPTSLSGKIKSRKMYKRVRADIFHHEDLIYDSWFSWKFGPKGAKHVVTFQDPPTFEDLWVLEKTRGTATPLKKIKWKVKYALRHKVFLNFIKHVDAFYSEAKFLIEKSKQLYKIKKEIGFLPNPVHIPKNTGVKAKDPTVCFLGRWDAQKRPWLFFELAAKYPQVKFIAMGQPQENPVWLNSFKKKYGKLNNLKMVGFVSENEKVKILTKSWALVSTSIREGLPVAFLESLASRTPIISYVNPDNLPERYGFWAKNQNFSDGIDWLLSSRDWVKKGREGRKYVEKWHSHDRVIKMHEAAYSKLW